MMIDPFLNPNLIVAVLMMLLTSGVRDLASLVSSDSYWQSKHVTVTIDQLTHELDPMKPADVSKLIGDLDADDPKAREEATTKIADIGAAAIPALSDAAKNGSPEVSARASALLTRIRAGTKGSSVRRLMAIRTLGEKKDAAALPALKALLDSKEMFEADYAKAAIAKIEGKPYTMPVAAEAARMADVGLLPSHLDMIVQIAPQFDGYTSINALIDQTPVPDDQKAKGREEANTQILKLLDSVGNIRLNSVTCGFYAAPPGVPGNAAYIAGGTFDSIALAAEIGRAIPKGTKVNGIDVFQIDTESAVLVSGDGHVVFLRCEPMGDLGIDAMTLALQKGVGGYAANTGLPPLVKSIDTKASFWAVVKMAPGLNDIIGPMGTFDTASLVANQSLDKEKIVTDLRLQAESSDPAKAKAAADLINQDIKSSLEDVRRQEKQTPFLKPMGDFLDGLKVEAVGGKASITGSMRDVSLVPAMIYAQRSAIAPNGPPQ